MEHTPSSCFGQELLSFMASELGLKRCLKPRFAGLAVDPSEIFILLLPALRRSSSGHACCSQAKTKNAAAAASDPRFAEHAHYV